jgi:glucose/arabinose dehydrogenase
VHRRTRAAVAALLTTGLLAVPVALGAAPMGSAQSDGPRMLLPNLDVRTAASGLVTPTAMAFLGDGDMLVIEKNTGRVQRVVDGGAPTTVLDLAVNFASERGLLGIAQIGRAHV